MKDLESRKKALAAEAEVYRQAMKLEIQNLKLFSETRKERYRHVNMTNPLISVAMPLITSFLAKRGQRKRTGSVARMISGALLGWKFYSKVLPEIRGLWGREELMSRYEPDDLLTRY